MSVEESTRREYEWAVADEHAGEYGAYQADDEAEAREVLARWLVGGRDAWLERREVGRWERVGREGQA